MRNEKKITLVFNCNKSQIRAQSGNTKGGLVATLEAAAAYKWGEVSERDAKTGLVLPSGSLIPQKQREISGNKTRGAGRRREGRRNTEPLSIFVCSLAYERSVSAY